MKRNLFIFLVLAFVAADLHSHTDEMTFPTEFEFSYTFESFSEAEKKFIVSGGVSSLSDTELNYLKVKTDSIEIEVPKVVLDVEGEWRRPISWKPECLILRPEDYGFEEDIGFYVYFEYEQRGKEAFTKNGSGKRRLLIRYLFLLGRLAEASYTIHEESAPGSKRWDGVDSGRYHPGDQGFSPKEHVDIQELISRIRNEGAGPKQSNTTSDQ